MLPPGTIGYIDEQDGVRAQQNKGEGCTVQVNKRGDPCSAGKVVIKIKNKPSSFGPTRTSYTCQLAVTTLKSILRRKPVCRPVHNFLSIVYNAKFPANADVKCRGILTLECSSWYSDYPGVILGSRRITLGNNEKCALWNEKCVRVSLIPTRSLILRKNCYVCSLI